jgi:4-azaleucine resistance transporter AzlC
VAGARAVLPLIPGIIPFALVSAYAAREAGLSVAEALGLSTIVFAGAAQMAFVSLVASGAVAPVILLTVLVINLRMVMYSASLAPHLRSEPGWRRLLMGYVLTDQAFAVSITRFNESGNGVHKGWFYLGTALPLWIVWQIFTLVGLLLGARLPADWGLEFTVPLVFLVLLVPAIRDRPSAEAALVGGGVAVMLAGLPYNLGLMVGAVSGIVWGVLAEERRDRRGRARVEATS